MEQPGQAGTGFFASLKRLGLTALSVLQTRLQLFSVEFQEEKNWAVSALLWAAALIIFGLTALLAFTAAIVFFTPIDARPYVLGALCLIYVGLAVFAFIKLRNHVEARQPPFSQSIAEIEKDISCLKGTEKN